MAATIREIANLAGVSIGTVSKVVNGHDQSISEPTRQRVLEIVRATGYRANSLAQGLRSKRRINAIGLVVPDLANPMSAIFLRGAEDAAYAEGFAVAVRSAGDDPRSGFIYMAEKLLDGVILSGFTYEGVGEDLVERSVPTVVVTEHRSALPEGVGQVWHDPADGELPLERMGAEAARMVIRNITREEPLTDLRV